MSGFFLSLALCALFLFLYFHLSDNTFPKE